MGPLLSENPELADLYKRIAEFEIDGAETPGQFVARLRKENGWSEDYADLVVREYKRFLFLKCVTPHPLTPSEPVDTAWHLHLTFTESYWDRLCGDVVGQPLHHTPGGGGADETERYEAQYRQTLALYRETFGSRPINTIWPKPPETDEVRPTWEDDGSRRGAVSAFMLKHWDDVWLVLFLLGLAIASGWYLFGGTSTESTLIVAGVFLLLMLGVNIDDPCTRCGRFFAVHKTGAKRNVLASSWVASEEWACRSCGYALWNSSGWLGRTRFPLFVRCPNCRATLSFHRTGGSKPRNRGVSEEKFEKTCRYCGHSTWHDVPQCG